MCKAPRCGRRAGASCPGCVLVPGTPALFFVALMLVMNSENKWTWADVFANVLGLFALPSYFVNILKHFIPEDADGGGMLLMSELPLGLEHEERGHHAPWAPPAAYLVLVTWGSRDDRKAQVPLAWEFGGLRFRVESSFIKLAWWMFCPGNSSLWGSVLCL